MVCEFIRDNRDKFNRNPCKSSASIKSRSPTAEDSKTTGNELDVHIKICSELRDNCVEKRCKCVYFGDGYGNLNARLPSIETYKI